MPSGPEWLRDKFTTHDENGTNIDDGIEKCEDLITAAGGKVQQGWITLPSGELSQEVNEAAMYLIYEWDYAIA
jgi:hypothetical protein